MRGGQQADEPPLLADALDDGPIVVVDSVGYRIKLVSPNGALAGTLGRPMPPSPVTARMQEAEIGRRSRKFDHASASLRHALTK